MEKDLLEVAPSVEVLISTMNQKDLSIVDTMNINGDCVAINQCNVQSSQVLNDFHRTIKFLSFKEKGLSRSRNCALEAATSDICIIADDDEIFVDNYKDIVQKQFSDNPNFDILVFQVIGIDKHFKSYPTEEKRLGYISSMKVSSVQIAFKRQSIMNAKIKFNEQFGAGSIYQVGEENIFLFEALRKGMKIKYIPVKIADLYMGDSTWFKGYNSEYFIWKGAAFTAMSKSFSVLLILQFALRKYKLYRNNIGILDAIKYLFVGRKKYMVKGSG
jgi:glycosyltransferase involved in cell wall biosynthesis